MPLYETKCQSCGRPDTIYRTVAERNNLPPCDDCGGEIARIISKPMIAPDIQPYISPNGNYMVNSRAQRQEDLAKSGAIAWEPGIDRDIARKREQNQEAALQPLYDAVDRIVTEMNVCGKLET